MSAMPIFRSILFVNPKLKPNPVDVFHFDALVETEVFSQTGDEHIQASAQKIIVFAPDGFKNIGAFHHLVFVLVQQLEQIRLLFSVRVSE